MAKATILHIAKWYPNKVEPLLGIFVRKQILAAQKFYNNRVISIYQTDTIQTNIHKVESNYEGIEEVTFYYKKGSLNKLRVLREVWLELKNSNCNLLHAHVMGWSSSVGLFFSKSNQLPFIISEHWSGYHNGYFSKQSSITKFLYKNAASHASTVCVVSEPLKNDMLNCGINAHYTILENVVDGKPKKLEKKSKFSFVFVGDLDQEHKNVRGILEAFAGLTLKNDNLHLDIVGEGKDRKDFTDLANDLGISTNVKFHGSKSNDEVFTLLSQSHVLVLNSFFETFSIICAEALLCGIPVISTKCGGPESFLSNDTGYLIEVNNTAQLEKAMFNSIVDYTKFDQEILKSVAKKFSSNTIATKIATIYRPYLT